jgi:hypothetical protein
MDGLVYVVELGATAGRKTMAHVYPEPVPGRVSIFARDGTLLLRWGDLSRTPGNFIAPHGLAVDSHGDVYVAEVTWTLYGRSGELAPDYWQLQKFARK